MISDTLYELADTMWGSADGVAPGGSLGDLIGGVLKFPSSVVRLIAEISWSFGS